MSFQSFANCSVFVREITAKTWRLDAYQTDPADHRDDLLGQIELKNLYQREADGHRQRCGCVDDWTPVDAVLSIVLHEHRYQSLLRRRVHRSTTRSTYAVFIGYFF